MVKKLIVGCQEATNGPFTIDGTLSNSGDSGSSTVRITDSGSLKSSPREADLQDGRQEKTVKAEGAECTHAVMEQLGPGAQGPVTEASPLQR